MKNCFLFDLDGTLIDSLADLADAANYALAQCGYPVQERTEDYKFFVGDGVPKLIERILPAGAADSAAIQKVRAVYAERYLAHCCDQTRPYPGIVDTLRGLKEKGCALAVVSNKPDEQTREIIGRLFEAETFDYLAGNQPGFSAKPDPALTLHVMEKLSAQPEECIFVGDSGVDMLTAHHCGVDGVGVLWGFRSEKELVDNGAGALVAHPRELLRFA